MKLIADYDLSALLVTRSEQGMTLLQPNKAPLHMPTQAQEVYDIIAGAPWGYRRRARLSLNWPPDKPLQMGFRKAGSSDIVNV
ncbi:hypothetical protein MJM59_33405, partial [Salmonella enterica subsp. enterica serovar Montevideo]|nr:hypothetical protein [Salmonella enterica subsp. enterica serovar Montevideo]